MTETPDRRVGEVLLGKYRALGVLGRGGMGVVYEAEDLRLGRRVAIKVLTSSTRASRDAGQRFHREARTIAALMHPHLVTLLDYDLLGDGTPAMVMERVDGASLRTLMQGHHFGPDEVVLILAQTLSALAICHERGVVHRDLKPENILLSRGGPQGLTVKVIDFGLTKLLADDGSTSLTVNGELFGSPRFMAPEQWLQGEVDARTDIYALGLIGYVLLRGEHFIAASNPFEICRAHLTQARPPLHVTVEGRRVPPHLEQVLRRAADPDPLVRYPSAAAMLEDLEPLLRDLPARGTAEHAVLRAPVEPPAPARSPAHPLPDDQDDPTMIEVSRAPEAIPPPAVDADGLMATQLDAPVLAAPIAPRALPDDDPEATTKPGFDVTGQVEAGAHDKVRIAFPGGIHTAITRGDVERAVQSANHEPLPPRRAPSTGGERERPTLRATPVTSARRPEGSRRGVWYAAAVVVAAALGAVVFWFR